MYYFRLNADLTRQIARDTMYSIINSTKGKYCLVAFTFIFTQSENHVRAQLHELEPSKIGCIDRRIRTALHSRFDIFYIDYTCCLSDLEIF